ncbi:MAG: hypothetical protein R3D63_01320 [Paracoccaceae bacterium]
MASNGAVAGTAGAGGRGVLPVLAAYVLACALGLAAFAAAAFVLFLINYAHGGETSFILSLPLALALGVVIWKRAFTVATGLWVGAWAQVGFVAAALTALLSLAFSLTDGPDLVTGTPLSLILMMAGGLAVVIRGLRRAQGLRRARGAA